VVRQGPCPGPASGSSPSRWPAARASLFRSPHTEVTFSDTHASPSRGAWFSRSVLGAAAVAASAARSLGRRHEARRSRLFLWARRCAPSHGRVRLRPASRSWPVWVGLAASGRKASSQVLARFMPAPVFRAPGLHKEAEASRGLVVRGSGRRDLAAGSCVALRTSAPCSRPRGVWWASAFHS